MYAADCQTYGPPIIELLDFTDLKALRLSAQTVLQNVDDTNITITDVCYYPTGRNRGPVRIATNLHTLRAFTDYVPNVKPKIGVCYTLQGKTFVFTNLEVLGVKTNHRRQIRFLTSLSCLSSH